MVEFIFERIFESLVENCEHSDVFTASQPLIREQTTGGFKLRTMIGVPLLGTNTANLLYKIAEQNHKLIFVCRSSPKAVCF